MPYIFYYFVLVGIVGQFVRWTWWKNLFSLLSTNLGNIIAIKLLKPILMTAKNRAHMTQSDIVQDIQVLFYSVMVENYRNFPLLPNLNYCLVLWMLIDKPDKQIYPVLHFKIAALFSFQGN